VRRVVVAAALASAACSLIVDTKGLSGGAVPADGGSPREDAALIDASIGDASTDAADASSLSPYRDAILADQPISYWRLDEGPGATVAKDQIGNKNPGKYVSVTFGGDGPFHGKTAPQFDGKSSRVEIADNFDLTGTSPYTVEAWVAPDETTGCQHIFTREQRQSTPKRGFALLIFNNSNEGLFFERYVTNSNLNSGSSPPQQLTTGTFTYVVGVYDGMREAIYVNGAFSQSGPTDTRLQQSFVADSPYIGAGGPGDCVFAGRIAEVAVYATALTSDRIMAHYTARTDVNP
jgi:hypothetical protein